MYDVKKLTEGLKKFVNYGKLDIDAVPETWGQESMDLGSSCAQVIGGIEGNRQGYIDKFGQAAISELYALCGQREAVSHKLSAARLGENKKNRAAQADELRGRGYKV